MNKNTRNVVVGVLFMLVLISILATSGKLPFAIGGSILSISTAELTSTFAPLNGQAWVLTFTNNGQLNQQYTGTFSPEAVDAKTADSSKPTKSFTITSNTDEAYCNYNIYPNLNSDNNRIYTLTYSEFPCETSWGIPQSPTTSYAQSKTNFAYLHSVGKMGYTCFAVGSSTFAQTGALQTEPDKGVKYSVSLDVGGVSQGKVTIDSLSGQSSGILGNNAYVTWQGNLVSGLSCGFNSNQFSTVYQNGYWNLASSQAFTDYKTEIAKSATAYCTISNGAVQLSKSCLEQFTNQVNSRANSAKSAQTPSVNTQLISSSSLSSARLKIVPQSTPIFPVSTLYIKASTLGIVTLVPDLSIVSTSSSCFKTGSEGNIKLVVNNKGSDANFNAWAECAGGFVSTKVLSQGIKAGESKTVYIPLYNSADAKVTANCVVKLEYTGQIKTSNQNACVDPIITCLTPYPNKFCDRSGGLDVISQCSSDGVKKNILATCTSSEVCDTNTFTCVKNTGDGSCAWYDIPCKTSGFFGSIGKFFSDLFSGVFSFFKIVQYVLALIMGFVSTFATFDLLERFKGLRRKDKVKWTISIIVGLSLAYLLFSFLGSILFWVLVVAGLIYQIFSKKIRSFIGR